MFHPVSDGKVGCIEPRQIRCYVSFEMPFVEVAAESFSEAPVDDFVVRVVDYSSGASAVWSAPPLGYGQGIHRIGRKSGVEGSDAVGDMFYFAASGDNSGAHVGGGVHIGIVEHEAHKRRAGSQPFDSCSEQNFRHMAVAFMAPEAYMSAQTTQPHAGAVGDGKHAHPVDSYTAAHRAYGCGVAADAGVLDSQSECESAHVQPHSRQKSPCRIELKAHAQSRSMRGGVAALYP